LLFIVVNLFYRAEYPLQHEVENTVQHFGLRLGVLF